MSLRKEWRHTTCLRSFAIWTTAWWWTDCGLQAGVIMELAERRKRALGPAYQLFYDNPAHLVRGKGVWLWDAEGRKYLDCYNNVASVGHCHPDVVAALAEQAATLNTHTRYLHENVIELSERIAEKMPGI